MINGTPTDIFTSLNPGQTAEASRSRNISDMGSDDFMALMIAQMKHQDPTKPMDQMAFMSQLAEFSSLSGIQELNGAFGELSTNLTGAQAVQASSLVGRSVAMDTQVAALTPVGRNEDGDMVNLLSATVDMGDGSDGGVFEVRDSAGNLVFRDSYPPVPDTYPLCGMAKRPMAAVYRPGTTTFQHVSSGGVTSAMRVSMDMTP